MYLHLREDISLGRYDEKPCLFIGDVTSFRISDLSFLVLANCDGTATENTLSQMVTTRMDLDLDQAKDYVRHVLSIYRQFVTHSAEQSAVNVNIVDGRRPRHTKEKALPSVVHWVVTLCCPRRCVYCVRNARWGMECLDSLIGPERALDMIERLGDLGAKRFYLDGGEPMLRRDFVDLCRKITDVGAELTLVTRSLINSGKARALKDAGVKSLQYSLDSASPAIADRLCGVPGFFQQAISSIENLVKEGIEVHVSPLITRSTADDFSALEKLAVTLGASSMMCSWFGVSPEGRVDKREVLTPDDMARFEQWYWSPHELPVTMLGGELGAEEPKGCASGRSCFVISPSGDVCLCDKAMAGTVVGSLFEHDPDEIWFSDAMEELRYPPREKFKGTRCYDCHLFDDCNKQGRCVGDPYLLTGSLYGPCKFCLDPQSGGE